MTIESSASGTSTRPTKEFERLHTLNLTECQVFSGCLLSVEIIDSFHAQLATVARTTSRELADMIHRWLEARSLETMIDSTGESCLSTLVSTLIAIGFPYALEISPEQLWLRKRPRSQPCTRGVFGSEEMTMSFIASAIFAFFFGLIGVPVAMGIARAFGLYVVIEERRAKVFTLFGEVIGTLSEPGLQFLWSKLGLRAALIPLFGKVHTVDLRLDQQYLRSQPVNSEEGAPMGIGIWYEMGVKDPGSYLFKNADPRGSLQANVSNAAVRTLSNMKLADMLQTRHVMSQAVRNEVTPRSLEWGYQLGSVYIRKVHFRDHQMTKQIEEKVVNRLRQVTSAIRQDGNNQVNIIKSSADRQAATEFARAAAQRPLIVGQALQKIGVDPEIMEAMYELLETQKLLESGASVTFLPKTTGSSSLLAPLIASHDAPVKPVK